MGVFSNKISRDELKSGDHIYSWRNAYLYSHHGIYTGDGKVIHFTRGPGQEVGTGTVLDRVNFSSSSSFDKSREPCLECGDQSDLSGVISSCLDCFLWDGELYRFEYDVTVAFFLAKARGGMCTLAPCDPPEDVLRRASFLLEKGFGGYNIFKNNCEDFAIYCKTGLLVVTDISVGRSGQMTSIVAAVNAFVSSPLRFLTTSFSGLAAVGCGMYCISRVVSDIGVRRDVMKIPVERLTNPDDLGQPIDTPTLPLLTSNLDKPFMKPCARDKKLQEEWAVPLKSIEDINEVFKNFCLGKLKSSPWSELDGLQPETKIIDEKLANINTKGFLTINSQPAVNGEKSDSPAVGWGGSGGFVYQKAYVELFCSKEKLNSLVDKCKALPSITYMAVNKAGDRISNVGQSDVNAVTWGVFPAKEIVQPTVVDPVSFMVWKDEAFEIWSRSWASLYAEADTSKNLLQQVQGSYYLVSLVDNDYVKGDMFSVFSDL